MTALRAKVADGRTSDRDRNFYVNALREYAELYGPDFTTAAFNPSTAKWRDEPELVDRYYAGRPDGRPWPSLNAIKREFGGFNAAREAAGLEPNRPGPVKRRRANGAHRPIRDVRDRRVYVPDEQLTRARTEAARANDRAREARARVAELAEEVRRLKARKPEVRERVKPEVRTVTKTKTIKVRDDRADAKLRAALEDARAKNVFLADQKRAAEREVARLTREAFEARREADAANEAERAAISAGNRAADRATALEIRIEGLSAELDAAREQLLGAREAAIAAELVKAADRRALAAEAKAARVEREAAEQAAAITGERRRLTRAEIDELRRKGPDGPKVFALALRKLARARADGAAVEAYLTEVAAAAVNWRDRL